MIKKFLPLALAVIIANSALAFDFQKPLRQSAEVQSFSGTVKKKKKAAPNKEDNEITGDKAKSIDYTLADGVGNALKLNSTVVGSEVYLAFEMIKENTSVFADDEITSVNITTGVYTKNGIDSNLVKDITIFIIEGDIENNPVYTQEATLGSEAFTEYKIALDSPYKIKEGTNFFVGYTFKVPNSNQYYLATDYVYPETIDGCWIGVKKDDAIAWNNLAEQIGSLCIGCTIVGENFPQDNVSLMQLAGPPYTEPGKEFTYQFLIKNSGYSASDVEMSYVIGDGELQTSKITLEQPLSYNEYDIISLNMVCNEERTGIPMKFKLSKVNGEENNSKNTVLTTNIDCFSSSKGFPKVHLIEEGTGTWCGWCPRGIVMMEYVNENYPDLFGCVAIHQSNGNQRDPMQVATPLVVVQEYMSGFPFAMIDREEVLRYMSDEEIDDYVTSYRDVPSIVGFTDLSATISEDKIVKVDSKVKFGLDFANNDRYRLAYYVVENGLGPYSQTNYYSGGGEGEMGGWEKKAQKTATTYNDVARYLLGGVDGLAGSFPKDIAADVDYEYSAEIDLDAAAVKKYKFTIIAFVIDNRTGKIANSKKITVINPYSGVKEIESTDASVVAKKYHSISGAEVKNPEKGIYVVTTIYSDGTVKHTKEIIK